MAGSAGSNLVCRLQEVCQSHQLGGTGPKLGPHATLMPPFRATERELGLAAVLMRAMWKLKPGKVVVDAQQVAVFDPPEEGSTVGAIYVEVEIPSDYHEFIERHKLNWPLPFVHPPATRNPSDRIWIPHITVLKGDGLHVRARKLLPPLNEYVDGRRIDLLEPYVFRKRFGPGGESWWEKVLV